MGEIYQGWGRGRGGRTREGENHVGAGGGAGADGLSGRSFNGGGNLAGVSLIQKGGGDYRGIGLVEVVWKAVKGESLLHRLHHLP